MALGTKVVGLTAKIGADTSDFIKSLKSLDKEINATAKTADELQKSLVLDYDDRRFRQAQKQAQAALEATNEKAKAIREQLSYLENHGGVDTDGYRKLETELAKTETQAAKLKITLDKINNVKFDSVANKITKFGSAIETAGNKTKILSAAAAGAIAGIYKLGTDVAKTGGELQDYADRLNVSAEAMQRWQYIAMQSGVETDQLSKAMAKSRDAIGTALSGETNTATKALEALIGDLTKLPSDTEKGFDVIINALANVKDSTMQAYYANEIFGERIATNLIPMINNGSDKLKQLNREFEEIGYLSNEDVQALADFDDKMNIVTQKFTIAKQELAIALLPLIEKGTRFLTEKVFPVIEKLADKFDNLTEKEQDGVITLLLLAAALSPVLTGFGKIITAVPNVVKAIGKMNTAWGRLSITVGTLVATGLLVWKLVENWGDMSVASRIVAVIGIITTAVLGLAVAFGVFHSAWSLGAAVAGIVAGIAAAVAAINSAKKSIKMDIPDYNAADYNITSGSYKVPSASELSAGKSGGSYYEDNSNYDININMDASGDLNYDAKALADAVIKEIALKKQARG